MKKLFLIMLLAFVSVNAYSQSDDADNDVYNMVDQSAKFQDGYNSIIKFVKENIKFPAEAQENNVHGKLMVSVVVEKDGSLSDIKIKKGLGYGLDEEIVRIITMMPKWQPAQHKGKAVRQSQTIVIPF
ncbi:MAG: TonB family protein [Bacteroidales bacterium]|nr:TonB family protein [Bacteroidales bacterium]